MPSPRLPSFALLALLLASAPLACDEHDHSAHDHGTASDAEGDHSAHDHGMGDMAMSDAEWHQGTEALSDEGHFYVTYAIDGDPGVRDEFTLLVSVYDAAQTALIEDAEVTFTPSMPSMGHGMEEDPVVTANGDGTFTVSNLAFSMGGTWLFAIEITSGETTDTVAFEVSCCE
jgi:hypothetical protein